MGGEMLGLGSRRNFGGVKYGLISAVDSQPRHQLSIPRLYVFLAIFDYRIWGTSYRFGCFLRQPMLLKKYMAELLGRDC